MPGVLRVYLIPRLVEANEIAGGIAVVVDQLRASTTICAALAAGALRVIPCLEPEEASRIKASFAPGECLTGGERESVRIAGFDLANSPEEFTAERVKGKVIAFTTTNGTKAAVLAEGADELLVGCLANLSALAARIGADERPVHIICAGTRDRVSLEDVLGAGAIVERLAGNGRPVSLMDPRPDDDQAVVALRVWREASARDEGIIESLRGSRGGRNLIRVGLGADVEFCARVDVLGVVPRWGRGKLGGSGFALDR